MIMVQNGYRSAAWNISTEINWHLRASSQLMQLPGVFNYFQLLILKMYEGLKLFISAQNVMFEVYG